MAIYCYRKQNNSPRRKTVNYLSYIFLTVGALLLFWSFYPILSFEVYSRIFIQNGYSSPVPRSDIASSLERSNSVLGTQNVFSSNLRDFTQADLWFPTKTQSKINKNITLKNYYLSIPKLNIKSAKVEVGGEDLSKSLIHYLPQTLPGEYGNIVIFGHSTLPQLYNPLDYKTVFTYLPSLEKGDKVLVQVEGVEYEYDVFDMFVINPEEVSVLEQQNDASYLTLITCVPPGTYWKRLVVKAKLTKLPQEKL
jgi:sortase A